MDARRLWHVDAVQVAGGVHPIKFDARGGWNTGFRSCAAWLCWRVGLDPGAARERVRVARALETLPLLAQALARGELSYAKVRALTRVATPQTEEQLLALGKAGTAEHVERLVRGWRRVDRLAEARETARQHASRALHVYRDEDGMVTVRGRLEPEVGARFVEGHHIRHWAQGGPTALSNLALLCRRLHRAVHEKGYQLDRQPDGELRFRHPDGRLLPEVPPPVELRGDAVEILRTQNDAAGLYLHARTAMPGWLGERLDVGWAIDVPHPLAR